MRLLDARVVRARTPAAGSLLPPARTALLALAISALPAACGPGGEEAALEAPRAVAHPVGQASAQPQEIPAGPGDRLVDVTARSGIDFVHVLVDGKLSNAIETLGSGAALLDADGDGRLDVYLVQGGWAPGVVDGERPDHEPTGRLYRNLGGLRFEDVSAAAGVDDPGFGLAAVAADVDGDGDSDLYACDVGPNRLYRNGGDGTFREVARAAGVADARCSAAATFLDHDADGDLDLYVANYIEFDPRYGYHYAPDVFPPPLDFEPQADALYRNEGDGTFRDVSRAAGIEAALGRGMSVVAADLDGDRRCDVFVSNDGTANFLWHNRGDGTFEERGLRSGLAFGVNGDATAAMTADWGDADGDGQADLVVTDLSYGSLYTALRPGHYEDRVFPAGIAALSGQYVSWGGGFLDLDADGDRDLLIVNGDLHRLVGWEDLLLVNDGRGHFSDGAALGGAYFAARLPGRAGMFGDLDDDGDLDVLVTTLAGRPVLLENRAPAGRGWLTVELRDAGANRAAWGARVRLLAGGRQQVADARCPTTYLSSGDPRLHFGLDGATRVERLEVEWPDGTRRVLEDLEAGRVVVVERVGP